LHSPVPKPKSRRGRNLEVPAGKIRGLHLPAGFFWIYSERKRPHDLLVNGLSKNSPGKGQGAQLYPRPAARQQFFHLFFHRARGAHDPRLSPAKSTSYSTLTRATLRLPTLKTWLAPG